MNGLIHPEWVNGRRLWIDTPMRDLIDRVRFGDPVKGWEGDDRLGVYWDEPRRRFELWRLEDDGQYRLVCRSAPDMAFDERIIDALLAWDRQRRSIPLHDEITDHNARVEAEHERHVVDWATEEIGPRLRHAIGEEA
jgi:hypothetical protein